jgi:hypothetical protein
VKRRAKSCKSFSRLRDGRERPVPKAERNSFVVCLTIQIKFIFVLCLPQPASPGKAEKTFMVLRERRLRLFHQAFVKVFIQVGKRLDGFSDGNSKASILLTLRRAQRMMNRRSAYLDNLRDGADEILPMIFRAGSGQRGVLSPFFRWQPFLLSRLL